MIYEFQQKHNYSPTYAELARQLGVSTITVFEHLESLERKGAIRRRRHEARSVEIVEPGFLREQNARKTLPVQGVLMAGKPLGTTGKKEDAPLGELMPFPASAFLLRVRGNHLMSFHILDGDYLVVEERTKALAGEQIVAELADGSVTVGISTGNGSVSLAGPTPDQSVLADWTRLHGVVSGLLRRSCTKTQLAGGMAG
jgi:repressor LexA